MPAGAFGWRVVSRVRRNSEQFLPSAHRRSRGAVIAKAGALVSCGVLKTVASIFVSPVLGYLLGSIMMALLSWVCRFQLF